MMGQACAKVAKVWVNSGSHHTGCSSDHLGFLQSMTRFEGWAPVAALGLPSLKVLMPKYVLQLLNTMLQMQAKSQHVRA